MPIKPQKLTKEEEDQLITKYLQTEAGRAHFRRELLQGWPDIRTALMMHYIPLFMERVKRRGKA